MRYLFKRLNTKIKTAVPYNHQSLQEEHWIKSLSTILTKHLTEQGQTWLKYLALATLAYKSFNSLNLGNYSPYELVFGRKPKSINKRQPAFLTNIIHVSRGVVHERYTPGTPMFEVIHPLVMPF